MKRNVTPSFFEKYASEYDAMTEAAARELKHMIEVQQLVRRFKPTSVLDAGCGTGLTSRLFAEQGVKAVGIDSSAEMIRLSTNFAQAKRSSAKFLLAKFEELPREFTGSFDLVVCIANSISGVSSDSLLRRTLSGFYRVLRPGGSLVLQLLNPSVIKKGEAFGVRVTRHGDILYHRYATRTEDRILLHVVRTDLSAVPPSFEVFVHSYPPSSGREFRAKLEQAGFSQVRQYLSLALVPGKRGEISRDLILVARRTS